ncbi:hypothetical protein D9Q98_007358 [Chlorella vulgaris]|uniref:RanBP-type and C3HC4-type zinc finger-containing protein 1 n=1 Tax=Chlorella vulgaris TaxID=3077 RepID=A0A9D4YVT3_CHLVU|nr:hypothetical protein D9Q98_007358 [Chlorella vulgaris]
MASHFDSLARELSCSICLCVMSPPVARLPCCHYFCMGCVQVSVRHKAQCPVCKAKVGRRDVSGDDTMDRVVKAFAQLEAHKDELLSGGGGTWEGAGGPAMAAQGAEESLGGGQPVVAVSADTSPQPEGGGGGGGICWLAGVDNNDYQSPSISFAGSAAQRRQQQQQQQQAAAAEGRRLSLHSIHTKPGDDEQQAEQHAEQEQAEEGCAELQAQPQQHQPQQLGKAPAREALAPAADKDKENAAEQQAPAGAGWQQRVPKTTAAQRAAAAQHQRHAEGTQPITKWVHPKQMGLSRRQPRARQQQAAAGAGSGGGGETAAAADQSSLPADGSQVQPAKQPLQPMQQQQQQQQQEGVQESDVAAAAGCESPGVSADLQSLALQVAATAAAVAAAASPCQGASQGASEAAEQLTPLPAPALAPRTDKVPAGGSPALEPAAVPSAAAAAAAAGSGKPVSRGRDASKGGRASSGRKRAASGGHASEGALEAEAAAADGAAGSAVVVPPGGKRGKTAAKASAGSSTAPARRRSAPALAATSAAAAAAAGASDRTPAPPLATGVGAGLASTGGVGVVSGRRRIPTRLVPWNCAHCTFENQGAASKCEICASKKKVLPSSELAADLASGATPATVAAAAAERLQVAASPAPAAAAAAEETAGAAAAAAGKPQRQRKMSGVGGGGGAGSSGKRRKVTAAPAPVPAPADDASPAAACPAAAPNADASADGGSGWSDPRGGSSGWVLLGSSLSAPARQQLQQLARVSGAAVVKEWSPQVTHVVCCTVDGAARRTFKFLRGVLAAKWVLTEAWLQACLEQEGPVNEEQFLVPADHAGCAGGAAAARSSALLDLPALLGGYGIYLAGEFANGGEVAELLLAAGAKRLSRPPAAPLQGTSGGPCTSFLLCEGPDTASSPASHRHLHEAGTVCAATCGNAVGPAAVAVPPALAAAKWYQKAAEAGVPVVSHRWLLDTISSYTALPLSAYCL